MPGSRRSTSCACSWLVPRGVYALVPRVPLQQVVRQRLLELADDLAARPVALWRDPRAVVGRPGR